MERRSIAGIALREDRLLVAKRVAGGPIGLRWEFPGGKVERGESDEEALRREFMEEFGIEVAPMRFLGESEFESPSGRRVLAAWTVHIPPEARFDLREHSKLEWLPLAEVEKMDLADSDKDLLPLLGRELA
ncbi:MAG: NUDIX domain-containing protein [Spirochaetes bacterium]|nr:NUDIX domain-containing protein [Spirochaetota bacterium]